MAISQDNPIKATEVMEALNNKANKSHTHDEYQGATIYKEVYVSSDYSIPALNENVKYIYYFEKKSSSSQPTIGIYTPRRGSFFYEAYIVGQSNPSIGLIGGSKKLIDITTKAVVAIEKVPLPQ